MRHPGLLPVLAVAALAFTSTCALPFSGGDEETNVTADSFEPDDAYGSATSLAESSSGANPATQDHTLHTSSDEDWLVLDVTDNTGTLVVQVEPISGGVGIENVDFVVYDAGVSEVTRAEGTFGNSTESTSLTTFATGTHYVKVFAPDGDTGEYKISWYRF